MKKLNNIAAAFVMMAILILGTTAANAGILVSDATGSEPQTCQTSDKPDWGIIIQNIVGIIIQNLTGSEISEVKTSAPTDCGIIIQN